jgi:hypothetical protein
MSSFSGKVIVKLYDALDQRQTALLARMKMPAKLAAE